VIEFSCKASFFGFFGGSPSDSTTFKFLILQQYLDIWRFCEDKLSSQDIYRNQLIILGTAGIGKSASRFLYILMWLEKEMKHDFEFVVFNHGEDFYVVHPNGNVFRSSSTDYRWSTSLLLLDPCLYLATAQIVVCRMLIVFTSPSPLVGQPNTINLSRLEKVSNTYVMNAPTVDDLAKLHYAPDEMHLKRFSWVRDNARYCSLRWFTFDETEQEKRMMNALNHTTREGLWDWFMSNTDKNSRDPRLPFRLCVIESNEKAGWIVSGFISEEIERYVFNWAMRHRQKKATDLVSLLNNRALRDGLGIYYEAWLFEMLGNKNSLYVSEERRIFTFSGLRDIHGDELEMQQGILYKLDRAGLPSIEGYALVKRTLLLLQSSISETHSAARHEDVKDIIHEARRVARLKELLVVYIVPSHQAFTPPSCQHFPKITSVVWGVVDDSEFFKGVRRHRPSLKRKRRCDGD
jgi:hypothetical protein